MTRNPLVSILIPAYNQEAFIRSAVESTLAQTYQNIEIIVHDDASTDRTPEILSLMKDTRLRVLRTQENHGMIGGWNYIMARARGDYIKFLAADDLLEPTCVEELVRVFHAYPQASLATCKRKLIDEEGKVIGSLQFGNKTEEVKGKDHARWVLTTLRENKIGEPTATLFRRVDANKIGGFDQQFYNFVDFEYWVRLLTLGDLVFVSKPLCSFRIHGSSSTSRAVKEGYFIDDIFHMVEKYYDTGKWRTIFSLTDKERESVVKQRTLDIVKNIKDLLVQGRFKMARAYMQRLTKYVSWAGIVKVLLHNGKKNQPGEKAKIHAILDKR